MIESVQELPISLTNNSAFITFSNDTIRTRSAKCCNNGWLSHQEGSPLYHLLLCGYYEVTFKVIASSATAGVIALGLYEDGILESGTTTASTITAAGDIETLTFTKVIQVCGKANTTLAIGSVPSVPDFTNLTGPGIDTQTPIIASGNLIIKKLP